MVQGLGMDVQTRCTHYHTSTDVVAIKFACCNTFYPCHLCHEALAGHTAQRWPHNRFNEPAVLCGVCGKVLTIAQYMQASHACPHCGAGFNPGCANHYHLYFRV